MKLFESIKSYNYRSLLRHNETFVFLVLLGFSLVVTIINPSFLSIENMFDLAKSSAGMAILAIGVFVVLLSGGIDVSFTAVAISAQYIAVKVLVEAGINSLALAFLISCMVGIALGSINAFLISIFRLRQCVRSKGTCYDGMGKELEGLEHVSGPAVAQMLRFVSDCALLYFRNKLTKAQHAMFELATAMAEVEIAYVFCKDAAQKNDDVLAAKARIFAADVALSSATRLLKILHGSDALAAQDLEDITRKADIGGCLALQAGSIADMDLVARAITAD